MGLSAFNAMRARKKAREELMRQGWIIDRRWASCPKHRTDLNDKEESE